MVKPRVPIYGEYKRVLVTLEYTEPIIGGQLPSAKDKEMYDRVLPRRKDGKVIVKASHFYAYLRDTSRVINLGKGVTYCIGTKEAVLDVGNRKPYQEQIPNLAGKGAGRGGRGITKVEALPAGVKLTTEFLIPTAEASGLNVRKFKKWLEQAGEFYGLSSYSKAYGRFKVKECKVVETNK